MGLVGNTDQDRIWAKVSFSFLSGDYIGEPEEHIRTQVQQEDFIEPSVVSQKLDMSKTKNIKLILKNIHPYLLSQLMSSGVTRVEALVWLGQQLEKDEEKRLQMEQQNKYICTR